MGREGQAAHSSQGKGKGIMVSDFITAGGRLMLLWMISDEQLRELGLPHRYVTQYLRYSRGICWTSDSMIDDEIRVALSIF